MVAFNSYKKRREVAVLGIEATPGVTATKQYMYRWLDKSIRSIPGVLENESAVGEDSRVNDSAIDVWHSEGSLGGKVTENGIAILAHGMFNKVVTTTVSPGVYKHALTRDKTVGRKSFSFWDVRPSGTQLYKSLYMDNLNINVEVGEQGAWLQADTSLKGHKHQDVTAITPVLDNSENEFTSRHVKLYLADNVAGFATAVPIKAKSFTLTMEETATVDHAIGEEGNDPEFDFAPYEVRGSMVVKYKKSDYEDALFTNKIHAMRFVATNGDASVEFIGTKVRFREVTNSDGRDDTVTQTISFYVEADFANGGKDMVCNITNTLATLV